MGQKNPIEMVYEKSQGQGPSMSNKMQEMQLCYSAATSFFMNSLKKLNRAVKYIHNT